MALKGYWKLYSNSTDYSGNSNNGTDLNVTYSQGGPGGQAATLSGTGSIKVGNPSSLQLSSCTMVSWVKTSTNDGATRSIAVKTFAYNMFLVNGKLASYSWGGSTGVKDSGVSISDGKFHMVGIVFSSGTTNGNKFYVDGKNVSNATVTVQDQTGHLWAGDYFADGSGRLTGQLQNMFVDDSQFSDAKMNNVYLFHKGFI